jgi:cytochrome c oxidase subunit 3
MSTGARTTDRVAPAGGRGAAGELDALIGMTILLGAWVMLFAALFFAYGVVRVQASEWPPFGAPRLPRGLPALNTLLLVASSLTLGRGLARARRGDARALRPALGATMVLGAGFLAAQIALWHGLIGRGLLPSSGVYGSVFFAFTGFHALHVLGGLIVLGALAMRNPDPSEARLAERSERQGLGTPLRVPILKIRAARLAALYWDFVAVIWVLMYLSIFCL